MHGATVKTGNTSLYPVTLKMSKDRPVLLEEESGWAPEPVWTFWRTDQSHVPAGI